MPYMDIWMYNSRPRIKVFLCYFLIFIAFFIFSDIMIFLYTKSSFKPMESYEIQTTSPEITVSLAESSKASGNVKGTIKNNTEEELVNKYIKFDFYTPRDVNVGTKYIKIDKLEKDEEKNYELGFRYSDVSSVKINVVEEDQAKNATAEELEISPVITTVGLIGKILALYVVF